MLSLDLPSLGIFDIPSTSRSGQAAAIGRLMSFVREADGLSFSGRTVLLNPGCRESGYAACNDIVNEIAAALNRRGAAVTFPDSTSSKKRDGKAGPRPRVHLGRRNSREVRLHSNTYRLPNMLFEVDMVVNIAGLFREPRAILAGAIYNMSELLCTCKRPDCSIRSLNPASFNATIVDFISKVAPDLNILVVPDSMRSTAQLLVSTDVVAVDCLAAGLAGYHPQEIPAVRLAAESGLGIGWPEGIRLHGDRPRRWSDSAAVRKVLEPPEIASTHLIDPLQGEVFSRRGIWAGKSGGVRPASVTYCPGSNSARTLASVATCVGEARCDDCQECVGDCPILVS